MWPYSLTHRLTPMLWVAYLTLTSVAMRVRAVQRSSRSDRCVARGTHVGSVASPCLNTYEQVLLVTPAPFVKAHAAGTAENGALSPRLYASS